MLDEEVLLKTSRNSGETMAMFSAVAAVCLTALLFGGDSDLGVGALIALGILAPISLYHGALNWQTARRGAVWKFPVLLLPNFAAIAIAAVGICRPVIGWVWIGGKEWAVFADNPQWAVVSGAFNPIYPITSELAALSAAACGLSLYFNGQRYYSANGLQDLLESETGEERLYNIIAYRSKTIEFALTHSDNYGETSFSFVNGQYTNDGGTHLSAFKEGVLKGINEFSGKNYKADEIRDGMIGAIAIKVKDPVFESQTKNKLGNTDVRGPIVAAVRDAVVDYLHKNREVAEILLDKVARNEQMHRQIQEVKKKGRETQQKTRLRIPKLKDCKFHIGDKWPRQLEKRDTMIFLTEGDSAAGSLEVCRDVNCQAIFALRGKPMNCYGEKFDKIYSNEELTFLMQALGIEDDIENLRYDKVVIATDADVDGLHIRNLLITYFLCFFEQLVLSGHLYVLETPLFRVQKPKEKPVYCYSEAERDSAAAKLGKKAEITRFKGLGEISPKEFGQFIGEEIKLQPVTLENMRNVPELLGFFMGSNTPKRREYIMNNLEVHKYE